MVSWCYYSNTCPNMDNYVEQASYKCVTRICITMGFITTLRSQRFTQASVQTSWILCRLLQLFVQKRWHKSKRSNWSWILYYTMRVCAIQGGSCSGGGQWQADDNKNNIDKGCDMTPATKAMQGFFFAVLAHCFQKCVFERQGFLLLLALHILCELVVTVSLKKMS